MFKLAGLGWRLYKRVEAGFLTYSEMSNLF